MPSASDTLPDLEHPLARQPATINPYRRAAGLVWNRLRWDLNPRSHISRRRLRSWRERHAGQKAVIICNGPSLLKTDLSLLQDTFTFGLNKINLLFEKNDFRPSCIVSINPHVIEQNAAFFNETDLPLFLDRGARDVIRFRQNVALLHSAGVHQHLARDCSMSLVAGYTVTVVALQLAFHMGFSNVALIGCDHSFAEKGPANKTIVSGSSDSSHFDPRYFSGGVRWQLPDLHGSEFYYNMARETYECFGRRVYNCTEGGKLEVFERMNLAEWVNV